jgi:hypothetical protein
MLFQLESGQIWTYVEVTGKSDNSQWIWYSLFAICDFAPTRNPKLLGYWLSAIGYFAPALAGAIV